MEFPRLTVGAVALAAGALAGCALPALQQRPGQDSQAVEAAWVELGPAGTALVRAVVAPATPCPSLEADGAQLPLRSRVSASGQARGGRAAAAFDMDVCEATLPAGVRQARVAGRRLPLPAARVDRLVVIGDTGCRIKNTEQQDCSPQHWPFAGLAADAARRAPDLVIHVGDYHYREGPCPAGVTTCQRSPLGYGWDVWRVDFFAPAAPLLAVAPWVMVRGNHEECRRAGQGWFRLLAPEPYATTRSCDEARNDGDADYTPPYAVPLGGGLQLIVFDSAHAGNAPLDPASVDGALGLRTYGAQMQQVAELAGQASRSWFVSHHPVLAYAPDVRHPEEAPLPGNPALQQAMRPLFGTRWFPGGVELALHGHVHLFQAIDFASGQPATVVAGNGGDLLDLDLSAALADGPADGTTIGQITHASRFGYLWMEREEASGSRWKLQAWRSDGSLLTLCQLDAGHLHCAPSGALH